jgi:hypothetical protein
MEGGGPCRKGWKNGLWVVEGWPVVAGGSNCGVWYIVDGGDGP